MAAKGVEVWRLIGGLFEFEENETLTDVGRRRFNSSSNLDVSPSNQGRLNTVATWAFLAKRKLSLLSIVDVADDTDLAVTWTRDQTTVVGGDSMAARILNPNQEYGNLGLQEMLNPQAIMRWSEQLSAQKFEIDGDLLDTHLEIAPGLVTLKSDRYELEYDDDLRVIRSWIAYIDNSIATRRRVSITLSHPGNLEDSVSRVKKLPN